MYSKAPSNPMDTILREGDKVIDAADSQPKAPPPESDTEFHLRQIRNGFLSCLGCLVAAVLLPAVVMPIVGMSGGAGVEERPRACGSRSRCARVVAWPTDPRVLQRTRVRTRRDPRRCGTFQVAAHHGDGDRRACGPRDPVRDLRVDRGGRTWSRRSRTWPRRRPHPTSPRLSRCPTTSRRPRRPRPDRGGTTDPRTSSPLWEAHAMPEELRPEVGRLDIASPATTMFDFDYNDGREQLLRLYDKGTRRQWIGERPHRLVARARPREPARHPRRDHPDLRHRVVGQDDRRTSGARSAGTSRRGSSASSCTASRAR